VKAGGLPDLLIPEFLTVDTAYKSPLSDKSRIFLVEGYSPVSVLHCRLQKNHSEQGVQISIGQTFRKTNRFARSVTAN
jgi:hypothetical protein